MAPTWVLRLAACVLLLSVAARAEKCTDVCLCTEAQVKCKGFTVTRQGEHLNVECSEKTDFDQLRNVTDIPAFRFRQMTYRFCPMPVGSVSLAEQLAPVLGPNALAAIQELFFVNNARNSVDAPLEPALFEGLSALRNLSMKDTAVRPLVNPALFDALPQLEWLDLREGTGRDPLDAAILRPLAALRNLELTQNKLTVLPAGLVAELPHLRYVTFYNNQLERLARFVGLPRLEKIDLIANRLTVLEEDTFEELPELRELILNNNMLTRLPGALFRHNSNLTIFDAQNQGGPGLTLGDRLFAGLAKLQRVVLAKCKITELPEGLFDGAIGLSKLDLSDNKLQTLPGTLLQDLSSLTELNLQRNDLHEALPNALFRGTGQLRVLNLSHNKLRKLNEHLLRSTTQLKQLYLEHNELSIIDLDAFKGLTDSLEVLNLSHNQVALHLNGVPIRYRDEEAAYMTRTPFNHLDRLTTLDLSHNRLVHVFEDFQKFMKKVVTVNLAHNEIASVDDAALAFLSRAVATLDLRWNRIELLNVTDPGRSALPGAILLDGNPLNCDCHLNELVRYERSVQPAESRFKLSELRCASPPALLGATVRALNPAALLCDVTPDMNVCPDACHCQLRPADHGIIVNCTGRNLRTVPAIPDPTTIRYAFVELHLERNRLAVLPTAGRNTGWDTVRQLYIAHNNFTSLEPETLPAGLELLDASANHLTAGSTQLVELLAQRTRLRNISLAANPLRCECGEPLIAFVHEHVRRITDSGVLRCADGRPIDSATVGELCRRRTQLIVALCVTFAALTLLALAMVGLYARYEHEVKVWLFQRNLLQWLVAEEQVDQDKRYDAFISYSHKDEAFITEHLVPTLEHEPMNFKLCWHVRDFMPGEQIITQITQAVEESRRTIIVLSKNYLESMWGQMEFQTAYNQSVSDKRNRVILIIYDNIGDIDQLDPQLRGYLNTNTYLRRDDRWFWQKLQYAMPHPRRIRGTRASENMRMASVDKLNLLQPPAGQATPASAPDSTPPIEQEGRAKGVDGPLASYRDAGKTVPFTISNGKLDLDV